MCGTASTSLLGFGVFVYWGLSVCWLFVAWRRRAARLGAQKHSCAEGRPTNGHSVKPKQQVAVVLPVRGARGLKVWESQLALAHDAQGKVEIVFAVDSERDPAAVAARELLAAPDRPAGAEHAHLHVAGATKTCSQKLHCMVAAAREVSKRSEYVLFLDDDIQVHRRLVPMLLEAMESEPSALLATGYPFDIAEPGASLATYAVMGWHAVLIIGFSGGQRSTGVWGGCMLFRAQDLLKDRHGLVSAWCSGGYSDDMIASAVALRAGVPVLCPGTAVFPQIIPQQSWTSWWSYMRRQFFVMDTYVDNANKWAHHAGLVLLAVLSIGLSWPLALAVFTMLCAPFLQSCGTPVSLAAALLLGAFLLQFALRRMYLELTRLWRCLCQDSDHSIATSDIASSMSWFQAVLGVIICFSAVPVLIVVTLLSSDITWSGIKYRKHRGVVSLLS